MNRFSRILAVAIAAGGVFMSAHAAEPFGARLFNGAFAATQFSGFNPDYQVAVGDKVSVRVWGATKFEGAVAVDAQGNIFIPGVGPLRVQGVRNGDLNDVVSKHVATVYRAGVGVYASLDAAQPVKIFVTGAVTKPGLYAGLSADSVLRFIDQAGGVDPVRGSYVDISVMRAGQVRAKVNLYEFLTQGHMAALQLADGDTVVVAPRRASVTVTGEVANANAFELTEGVRTMGQILAVSRVAPAATHVTLTRAVGTQRDVKYMPLAEASNVVLADGDEIAVNADLASQTLTVRVEGRHQGEHALVLKSGATLSEALAQIRPSASSDLSAVQLYRKSVAAQQKEALDTQIRRLETLALNARSATQEEATLRGKEAELVMQFIERARKVETKGRVVLDASQDFAKVMLEPGDVLVVPDKSSVVAVHGDVTFPTAVAASSKRPVSQYVKMAGGLLRSEDETLLVVAQRNGFMQQASSSTEVSPGEEVFVLPKPSSKNIEVTRGITQILYQVAIAARIVLGL